MGDIHRNKQRRLDRIREKLAAQMKQKISDEDERIERVLREEEEKYIETEKEKETKLRKTLQDIAEHRSKQVSCDVVPLMGKITCYQIITIKSRFFICYLSFLSI